jgi:RimJ/RimL family protein N-acetyltransferase
VHLRPLRAGDAEALYDALGCDEEIWRYLPTEMPQTLEEMRNWVSDALCDREQGRRLPFTVLHADEVIGSTSYTSIFEEHRQLEIGWTWYRRDCWRSSVNTECKFLLLRHAFETLGCIRVQLRTDERNQRSREAIERIGGRLEGIIRKDRIIKGGHHRSSAQFSLLAEEWPARKLWFEEQLRR